ncbi:hypothetical protein A5784_06355 [Mycobacterium sp. 852013-50091_SCH5140682]|nr:hypothetical protein A5784_06355 [Mycobacterium sp. 852013-50091_SCH5140682]
MNVDRVWVRNTAISAAIACGAMVAGPGVSGTAVASADLLGVGVDVLGIFGHHKDNKKSSNHRAGANGKQNDGSAKTGRSDNQKTGKPGQTDKRKTGLGGESSGQKSVGNTEGATNRAAQSANTPSTLSAGADVAETSVSVPEVQVSLPSTGGGGGGGGGGAAASGRIGRAPNLAAVPTAPSSRQIVIHAKPAEALSAPAQSAPQAQSPALASPAAPVVAAPVPAVVPPPMVVLPLPPLPEIAAPAPSEGAGRHAAPPAAPSTSHVTAPSTQSPKHAAPTIKAIPETFRIGYADYLRVSSTTDLVFAVLPGLAGMVLLTAAGGAVGFRQARAARTLPPQQIARFLP